MELTRYWARAASRRNRRGLVGIVVLFGLLGGLSLFTLAGARRTQSAYPRFLTEARASTMAVDYGQYDAATDQAIADFPEVKRSTSYVAFNVGPLKGDRPQFNINFETLGTFDGRFFTMDRFAPTRGRMPDPKRVDEVAMNELSAKLYGYRVGQHLTLGTYATEQLEDPSFYTKPPPPKITTKVTIVGIGLFTDEVIQDDTNRMPLALVTPAFSKMAAKYVTYAWQGLTLRRGDADVEAVKTRYLAASPPGIPQFFRVTSVDTFHVEQAVRPLSLALALFGAIAGLACLVIVGLEINRQMRSSRRDHDVLRALGAEPAAVARAAAAGPIVALAAGTMLAAIAAWAASPLMPLGGARKVEVSPGLDIDWTVLAGLAAAMFGVLAVAAAISAFRMARNPTAAGLSPRRSRVVSGAIRAGLSPTSVTGLRFAFEPSDSTSTVAVGSVLVATITAVTTLVVALTFGSSFRTMLDTPPLYGWNWNTAVYDQSGYGRIDLTKAHRMLDHHPEIAGWSGAYFGADSIDGQNLPLLGMELGSKVAPPLLSGRMIASNHEVVLGSATARNLHKGIGDRVRIGVGKHLTTLRVVGTATLPAVGVAHGAHTSLGVGAIVVPDLVPGFDRNAKGDGGPGSTPGPNGPPIVFIRYSPGADPAAAHRIAAKANATIGQFPGSAELGDAQRPAEIANSTDVGSAPTVLAVSLGLATAVSLAIGLAGSVRRRRRDLALLQSLGFTQRQMASSVAWQATAIIAIGLAVGIPVGVAVGRVLWWAFAHQLDVVPHLTIPVVPLLVITALALSVANLAAWLASRSARRLQPAVILRQE